MALTPGITDSVFDTSMADVKFEVYDSAQVVRELVPGGKNMSVTWENKQFFSEALLKYVSYSLILQPLCSYWC
jgi:hypothetical protein